ncbi:MAG: phage holin family protein [Firmicutes bacterium]|nr:phage holin family protein [Bacillota bacterium]
MNERLTAIKTAVTVAFSALAAFLGWKGVLALVWVVCMALDYLSGSAAACKAGTWSSQVAREGLWHKGGMILVVLAAAFADLGLTAACANLDMGFAWPEVVLPLVLVWYILTEIGSVLENARKLGAAVPEWLIKGMRASLRAAESAAEKEFPSGETQEEQP